MKKSLLSMGVLALVLALTACTKEKPAQEPAVSTEQVAKEAEAAAQSVQTQETQPETPAPTGETTSEPKTEGDVANGNDTAEAKAGEDQQY